MSYTTAGEGWFFGGMGRGKAALPPDAAPELHVKELERALRTIVRREQGAAAPVRSFAGLGDPDAYDGHVYLSLDAGRLLEQYGDHPELRALLRAVQERGPAVRVTLTTPVTTRSLPSSGM